MLSLAACGGGGGSGASTPVNVDEDVSAPAPEAPVRRRPADRAPSPGDVLSAELAYVERAVVGIGPAPRSYAGDLPRLTEAPASQLTIVAPGLPDGRPVSLAFAPDAALVIDVAGAQTVLRQVAVSEPGVLFVDEAGTTVSAFLFNPDTVFASTLGYTTYGAWSLDFEAGTPQHGFALGVETPVFDMPTAGSATYGGGGTYTEAFADGLVLDGQNIVFAAADFGAGTIRASINLVEDDGGVRTLRSRDMAIDGSGFRGGLAGQGCAAAYAGGAEGRFFGPGAAELGGTFEASGPTEIRGGFVASRVE